MAYQDTKPRGSRRGLKLAAGIGAALAALLAAGLLFAGNYLYDYALNPRAAGGFASGDRVVDGSGPAEDPDVWLVNTAQDAALTSRDGLRLHAYRVEGTAPHRYAVVCHGYQSNASRTGVFARRFYELGFTVLAPDARGHGLSEGDYIGMGWPERLDIVDWCAQLTEEDPQAEIVLFGVSMGGATVMMASGEAELPANVKCVVEDCGYTSVWDEFAGQLKELFGLPTFPFLNATSLVARLRAGYGFREASAAAQVAKSVTPTLFIHGDADTFVPYWMLDVVYEAAACEKEKLVIPGAAHGEASQKDSDTYWRMVEEFLARHMGA